MFISMMMVSLSVLLDIVVLSVYGVHDCESALIAPPVPARRQPSRSHRRNSCRSLSLNYTDYPGIMKFGMA